MNRRKKRVHPELLVGQGYVLEVLQNQCVVNRRSNIHAEYKRRGQKVMTKTFETVIRVLRIS